MAQIGGGVSAFSEVSGVFVLVHLVTLAMPPPMTGQLPVVMAGEFVGKKWQRFISSCHNIAID
jgi:hypothetical protein